MSSLTWNSLTLALYVQREHLSLLLWIQFCIVKGTFTASLSPSPLPPSQALSSSQPFTPLSSLLSNTLYMNRPILTVNLLREAPPTAVEATPPPAVEPSLSQSRSKSRLNAKR